MTTDLEAAAGDDTVVAWLTEAEQQAWRPFITAVPMLMRQMNSDLLRSHDLSLDDYGILAMLSEAEEERLRFGDLAEILRVPKAHITYRFRRLEERGLVTRERCETDARGAFAALTDAGREAIREAARSHVVSVRRRLLDHIRPELLESLGEAMRAVVDAACADVPDRP